ncbi:glycosyltransferase family 2 protein [Halomicrobium sp. LC1Hm]|uniref:glycosyltransferase family 2 protein n=1 Tax=Halomicrobium sp. LC1Hm TaxID=2610902 RepID=UPI0012983427|nr:glycosyltransferase family 2 protein [Halomicrobium sp. LC1Hm]
MSKELATDQTEAKTEISRCAVIPAYNEGRTIGSVVLETLPYVDIIIVVDDGSDDRTAAISEAAGAEVISLGSNRGKGAALKVGFEQAMDYGASVIVTLDADGQHNAGSIPELIAPIEAGEAEVVVGSRQLTGDGEPSFARCFGRWMLDSATNLTLESPVCDTQSGYRSFSRDALEVVGDIQVGMGVESEMLIHCDRAGLTVSEVAIEEHYNDEADSSTHPIRHAWSVIRTILSVIRFQNPLFFFGIISLSLLGSGAIFGFDTATHYYATREFWPGKALLSILCLIIGVQFGTIALLFDYFNTWLQRR